MYFYITEASKKQHAKSANIFPQVKSIFILSYTKVGCVKGVNKYDGWLRNATFISILLLTYLLTKFIDESPSRETDSILPDQEIPRFLWNPKTHYHVHNNPSMGPYPEPDEFSSHRIFLRSHFNIALPSTPRFESCLFPSHFVTKMMYASLPCVQPASPISSFDEAIYYAFFCILQFHPPSKDQLFSSAPCYQNLSISALPLMRYR